MIDIPTDTAGNVTYRYIYTPYGTPTQLNASWSATTLTEDLYLFTGREYCKVAGIYNYRARAYDPSLGRFLQRDPIGIWGDGINFGNGYAYVGGDPGNERDPSGRKLSISCDTSGFSVNCEGTSTCPNCE